jgi:hypothetical protein
MLLDDRDQSYLRRPPQAVGSNPGSDFDDQQLRPHRGQTNAVFREARRDMYGAAMRTLRTGDVKLEFYFVERTPQKCVRARLKFSEFCPVGTARYDKAAPEQSYRKRDRVRSFFSHASGLLVSSVNLRRFFCSYWSDSIPKNCLARELVRKIVTSPQ